jgi:hypothetical protein
LADLECIKQLYDLANTLSLKFAEETYVNFFRNMLVAYPDTTLYISVDSDNIYLDPDTPTKTICNRLDSSSSKTDEFTTVLKKKYYDALVTVLTQILDIFHSHVTNLQHLFLHHLTQSSDFTIDKPVAELCKSITRMLPIYFPTSKPKTPKPSVILDNLETNTLKINAGFEKLNLALKTLCTSENNSAIVKSIYHTVRVMETNIKNYIASFAVARNNKKPSFPQQLPILISKLATEEDLMRSIFTLVQVPTDPEESAILIFFLEWEKVSALHSL